MNSENMKNRQRLLSLLERVPDQSVPIGWTNAGTYSVGGLSEIGFSRTSDLLLVLSSTGRGVIDPVLGAVVARDEEPFGSWLNDQHLLCDGIGPLADETIQLAGLWGGGMRLASHSGESIEAVSPH
ncbi:hypothetical protein [Stenotrophomonas sp.]|uniref:hypothetical protein n=1 Tax=Stenotrophomonas sp. TaxID=69392 RepID=UPI0028A1628F|nr:hypothetical protein [Stenotrophomonas sp.]